MEIRSYDATGQLVSQVDKNGGTVINSNEYTYDESGNITQISKSNGTGFSSLTGAEMEYDKSNRLVKYNGNTVEYDADGNMIYGPLGGSMTEFEYDCRNRLIRAGNTSYGYDAENNRISKTADGIETRYAVESSGSLTRILSAETVGKLTYFIYGTGLISQENSSGILYYHFNNIGSTEAGQIPRARW